MSAGAGACETPPQALAALDVLRDLFREALLAVYLHGSAVSGGLRPASDIDLIAVLDRPMTDSQRKTLLAALLRLSARHPSPSGGPRCVELMVFLKTDLAALAFPAQVEFLYGEWLRDTFEAGYSSAPARDPENTLVLTQARRDAIPLFGPSANVFLPGIPVEQVRRAMRDALPGLVGGLKGDERNVLLTLARMWRTAETGVFVAKDVAAAWAAARMPAGTAETLVYARDAYVGTIRDEWEGRQAAARETAAFLEAKVSALL